jgi:hypothetical protein
VIFAPIRQVGCRRARSGVTVASSAAPVSRNGPPDAVRSRRAIERCSSPTRHCQMAECSESMGRSQPRGWPADRPPMPCLRPPPIQRLPIQRMPAVRLPAGSPSPRPAHGRAASRDALPQRASPCSPWPRSFPRPGRRARIATRRDRRSRPGRGPRRPGPRSPRARPRRTRRQLRQGDRDAPRRCRRRAPPPAGGSGAPVPPEAPPASPSPGPRFGRRRSSPPARRRPGDRSNRPIRVARRGWAAASCSSRNRARGRSGGPLRGSGSKSCQTTAPLPARPEIQLSGQVRRQRARRRAPQR